MTASNPADLPEPTDAPQSLFAFWGTLLLIAIWILMAWMIPTVFFQPPAPISASADADKFSAERARVHLEALVGDDIPHPAGSPQNDVVRERIMAMLREFGYQPEIQKTQNNRWQSPDEEVFPLENILARLPGKTPGQAVMLAAHYDSVQQGPGASDDGVGTAAVLEIARMLKQEGPFEHDIILLISDGEELGLLGADKFVELHPWADEVECVINLEARGTTGPSMMFETSEHSRWLVPTFARSSRRPMTSSLFYEIYKLLPNDTDFTEFKQGGMQGFNFAFIGKVKNYHTPNDDLEHVDMNSFQHHGENMLRLARILADIDFDAQPKGRVVYFDVLGRKIIWWPASWSIFLSLFALALIMAGAVWGMSTDEGPSLVGRLGTILLRAVECVFVLTAMFGVCFIINLGMAFDGTFDNPWPDFPWSVQFAFFSIAITFAGAVAWVFKPSITAYSVWAGVWCVWGVLAVVVSATVTGASYLLIVPALVAGIASLLSIPFSRNAVFWASAAGALACGFMWLPSEVLFFDALGFKLNLALIFRVVLICSTMLPVIASCHRSDIAKVTGLMGIISILAAIVSVWMVN